LIVITKDITTIQHKQISNTELITALRKEVRDQTKQLSKFNETIREDIDRAIEDFGVKVNKDTNEVDAKVIIAEMKHKALDTKLRVWLNLGLGGWAVMLVVLIIVAYTSIQWIDSIESRQLSALDRLGKVETRTTEVENKLAAVLKKEPGKRM
jgi:hypothetical protein